MDETDKKMEKWIKKIDKIMDEIMDISFLIGFKKAKMD